MLQALHLNHKASPLALKAQVTLRQACCVCTPTPKLGLSQHIHPSLCLLSNACGSSFKACLVARNAKGNGALLFDQLWVLLPACTASLKSPGWAEQQDSNHSDTLGCVFGANTPRNVTQRRPGEQKQIPHHCPSCCF